jgi:hypothetical protein
MKYPDLISGLFWLLIGLVLTFWALTYQIGSLTQPGPGYLPLALGILLILLSVILLVGHGKKGARPKQPVSFSSATGGWKKVVYTVLVLGLAAFLFETLGYLLTFFLLIAFLMKGTVAQSWGKVLLTALLTTAGVYIVFVLLLEQPLPRGFLGV